MSENTNTPEKITTKKVVRRKASYHIIVEEYTDGSSNLKCTNKGFNGLELLGVLTHRLNDITSQVYNNIVPKDTVIERTVIVLKNK
jgi:hypothetical protein